MMVNMARSGLASGRRWKSESGIDLCSPESLSDAHVLAVDDSVIDRKVIEGLLRTTSCKVTAVDSGMRALEFLGLDEDQRTSVVDGSKIDLIITDYCMPGMTGFELLKRIKNSSAFKETPVVIMSSENVMTRINRCMEEGAEAFIVKPVKLADVKRLTDCMSGDDKIKAANATEIGINKRKQRDASYLTSDSSSSRSLPSVSSMVFSDSQSPPSISLSSSPTPSLSLDSSDTPSSPSGPLDCSNPNSPSGPLDSPVRSDDNEMETNS